MGLPGRLIVLCVGFIGVSVACRAEGAPFAVAENGAPRAAIVIGEKPAKAARLAAAELQHVIRLVTGAKLPIVATRPSGGSAFYVGCVAGGDASVRGKPFEKEEYLVAFRGNDCYLCGHDEDDFMAFDYADENTFPDDIFCYRSTTYAVYDFLEKYANVRFYGFGDEGIAFERRVDFVIVPGPDVRRAPFMDAERRPYFSGRAASLGVSSRDQKLLAFRWRQNAMFATVNHSVLDFWFRFWKRSPSPARSNLFVEARHDYFAKGYEGKFAPNSIRGDYPDDADLPPQLCPSNPEVVKIIAEDAEKVYSGRGKDIFAGNFTKRMDGQPFFLPMQEQDSEAWCQCETCRSNERLKDYDYRHFDWTARAARAAVCRNPELGIATLAYGQTLARPEGVDMPPNLAVKMCLGVEQWFQPYVYAKEHGIYRDWMDHEGRRRVMTVWLYLLNPSMSSRTLQKFKGVFPVIYPHRFGRYFQEFCRDGVRGWFAEIDPRAHLLEAYLGARLSDDPTLDPEKMITEFHTRYYGAAAGVMRRLYDRLEEVSGDISNHTEQIRTIPPKVHIARLYDRAANWHLLTRERVDEFDGLYRQAVVAARTEIEKVRVARFGEWLWTDMPSARADWERTERVQAIPTPHAVAFADIRPASRLRLDRTLRNEPAKNPGEMSVVTDGKRLVFTYTEQDGSASAHANLSGWENGLELFLAGKKDSQYLQVMIPPAGDGQVRLERIVGEVRRTDRPNAELGIRSRSTKKVWTVSFSIPLSLVPSFGGERVFLHVFRSRLWPGGESLAWSPIFDEIYVSGLGRMGEVTLAAAPSPGDWMLPKTFSSGAGHAPDGWNVLGEPLQDGESVTTEDDVLKISGGTRWLHLCRLNDFRPVTSRERLVFEFEARGTEGKDAWAVVGAFFVCGAKRGAGRQLNWERLTKEWRPHRVIVDVRNTVDGAPVTMARAALGVSPGTHVEFRKLKILTERKDMTK